MISQTLRFTNGMRVAGNWKTSGSDEGLAVEEYDSDTNGESGVTFAFMHDGQLVVNGEGRVDLYDIQGRLLESVRVSGDQNRVEVPSLASGVYLLRLTSQGNVRVQKIVINKR